MVSAKIAHGQIVEWEDAEDGDDGRLHWSSAVAYTFTLPNGREVKGVSKGSSRLPQEWANLKNPIPSKSNTSRQARGSIGFKAMDVRASWVGCGGLL
jgi:hypothetical protein